MKKFIVIIFMLVVIAGMLTFTNVASAETTSGKVGTIS